MIAEIPLWVLILEAAGGDPLRAAELEDSVSQTWWERYMLYRQEKAKADREERKRLGKK